ncbi:hypothetical protein M5K25_008926 [Dendrobium thyrsiflorum]|uniref:Uncharacterized protein n=1 Tax=Dendrobium thyrsiflorum TaxID=117978 RepID=A0ABD0VGN9_DENTH
MEEQMRLYIRLAMEDSGFHLHTSMDNNIYNLINVTRFPSFDTSARMRSSIFNLAPLDHLSFRLLVCSIATTFVSHRGREAYHTGGYDPVVPPVAPPPDRIGVTDALIRLSLLLRQSFVLKSGLCSPQVPRKRKGKQVPHGRGQIVVAMSIKMPAELLKYDQNHVTKRTTVGTPILTDGDPVGKVRESTTTVVTPHTDYGDPVGRAIESTPTVVTPHTNYGDPAGRVRKGKPTTVTPHTDYGDPVGKETESIPTVVAPHTNHGDPVGRVSPPNTGLLSSLSISPSRRDKTPLDTTINKRRGETRGKRDLIIHSGFHKAWCIGTLWDTDTVKQRGMPTRSRWYVKGVQLVHRRTVRVQWTTNTGRGRYRGRLLTRSLNSHPVPRVEGPFLNTTGSPVLSQTRQETHLVQESWLVRSDRTIDVLQQNLNCMLLLQLRFTLKTKRLMRALPGHYQLTNCHSVLCTNEPLNEQLL